MSDERQTLLAAGRGALEAGDWLAARDSFRAALGLGETGEALFGLGIAVWWLGETEVSLRYWERAYAAFRRRPDPAQAVLAAVYLCLAYRMSLGNDAASRGWLGRAASVVEECGLTAMNGWVLLCRAYLANDSGQPRAAEGWAQDARVIARRSADADLELCATSELGAALVGLGRIEEGVALLDEAMAAALAGEGADLDTVVLISCRTITSCSRGGDFKRATQWIRTADDFHRRYGAPHLYTTCRTHYGGILFAVGKWGEAEEELLAAVRIGKTAEPALHAQALSTLAELHLAQGRLEEAAGLLAGYEDHPSAARAVAALHLARGEPVVASSLLRRRLREVDEESLEGSGVLELLAEAEIAQGAIHEASTLGERLADLGSKLGCDLIVARGERVLGAALLAAGDVPSAIDHLERALAAFGRLEMPLECGRTRFLLAGALWEDMREAAVAEARAALTCFDELGAARDADKVAALLRSCGIKTVRSGHRGVGLLTKREIEILALLGEGLSNRDIGERLFISRKTVEHHVASVLRKLGLGGRGEATAYAVRHLRGSSATK